MTHFPCPRFSLVLSGVFVLMLPGFVGGCASRESVANPSTVHADRYPVVFDAAAKVLRDAGFTVDRSDYRFGQITSDPKGSATLFEPWQGDNVTAAQAAASTLGNLRRTVRVTLGPGSDSPSAPYKLEVEVLVERYQSPTRRMSGATKGSVFYNLSANPSELADRGIAPGYWEPVGRDPRLEQRLLSRILDALQAAP